MKTNKFFLKIIILIAIFSLGILSHKYYDERFNNDSLIVNNHDTLKLNFEKGGVDIRNYLSLKKERSVVGVSNKSISFFYKKNEGNEVCLYFYNNGLIEKIKNFKDSGNNSFVNFHNSKDFLIDRDLTQCLSISGLHKVYIKDSTYLFNISLIGSKGIQSKLFINSKNSGYSYDIINDDSGNIETVIKIKFHKSGLNDISGLFKSYNYIDIKVDSTISTLSLPFRINFNVL